MPYDRLLMFTESFVFEKIMRCLRVEINTILHKRNIKNVVSIYTYIVI